MSDVTPYITKQDLATAKDGSRADGRPEGYMLPQLTTPNYTCSLCEVYAGINGAKSVPFNGDDGIVMMNAHDTIDGGNHILCKEHQPEDIVIFNPATGNCCDKKGENYWRETENGVVPAVKVG